MSGKLKISKNFVSCPVDDEDEIYPNGIFEFNITKMLDHIQKNPDTFQVERVAVKDFYGELSVINESHVDSVDLSKPVILAEIAPGRYNLIDGHHRMEKARRCGIETVPAYRLHGEQFLRFLTDESAYSSYVEYWNSKLK